MKLHESNDKINYIISNLDNLKIEKKTKPFIYPDISPLCEAERGGG
jgi:hypothetical protein